MQAVEFLVNGDPIVARNTAAGILQSRGFNINWSSDWAGVAVKGNTAANVLLGPLAEKFVVGIQVSSTGPGQSVIRFERRNSGWIGGAIGARRVSNNMKALRDQFGQAMTENGMLAEVKEL
jgi:hypothetical protein